MCICLCVGGEGTDTERQTFRIWFSLPISESRNNNYSSSVSIVDILRPAACCCLSYGRPHRTLDEVVYQCSFSQITHTIIINTSGHYCRTVGHVMYCVYQCLRVTSLLSSSLSSLGYWDTTLSKRFQCNNNNNIWSICSTSGLINKMMHVCVSVLI